MADTDMKRILVACEFSGVVRDAFAAVGWDAWSCDLLPTERPGQHIQDDVLRHLEDGWDLMIAHPPCTFITNAGVRHLHEGNASKNGVKAKIHGHARMAEMVKACDFFNALKDAPIIKKALENPIPHHYATDRIGEYTQLIQPWMFGHGETKATCFWLHNLPPLMPTHAEGDLFLQEEPKERVQRVHLMSPGPNRWKERSRTYEGIAKAMAEQWGRL